MSGVSGPTAHAMTARDRSLAHTDTHKHIERQRDAHAPRTHTHARTHARSRTRTHTYERHCALTSRHRSRPCAWRPTSSGGSGTTGRSGDAPRHRCAGAACGAHRAPSQTRCFHRPTRAPACRACAPPPARPPLRCQKRWCPRPPQQCDQRGAGVRHRPQSPPPPPPWLRPWCPQRARAPPRCWACLRMSPPRLCPSRRPPCGCLSGLTRSSSSATACHRAPSRAPPPPPPPAWAWRHCRRPCPPPTPAWAAARLPAWPPPQWLRIASPGPSACCWARAAHRGGRAVAPTPPRLQTAQTGSGP
mmetsp:Transcript_32952/g.82805  ORF Transcript_32952/g.82805 Transcript_32952/m.82805 type:complete len:303 (-) Transcript_32952:217-1125(-)